MSITGNFLGKRQWVSVIGAILATLVVQEVRATTIETAFNDLVSVAAEVAIVEIENGSVLKQGDQNCLSVYDAKVLKQFKGSPRKSLTFGSVDGLEIGKKYFVSLYNRKAYVATRSGILSLRLGAYSVEQRARIEAHWTSCQTLLPERIAGGEVGAMAIETPSELGYAEAVNVPSDLIRLPKGTRCVRATSVSEFDKLYSSVWVAPVEIERITLKGVSGAQEDEGYATERDCPSPPARLIKLFSAAPNLWALLDSMEERMPLTKPAFEALLNTSLALESRDQRRSVWQGGRISIKHNLGIVSSSLDLNAENKFDQDSRASIRVTGECITYSDIEEYYGALSIMDSRGGPDSDSVYGLARGWGDIRFGFEAPAPGCLAVVDLRGRKRQRP